MIYCGVIFLPSYVVKGSYARTNVCVWTELDSQWRSHSSVAGQKIALHAENAAICVSIYCCFVHIWVYEIGLHLTLQPSTLISLLQFLSCVPLYVLLIGQNCIKHSTTLIHFLLPFISASALVKLSLSRWRLCVPPKWRNKLDILQSSPTNKCTFINLKNTLKCTLKYT